SQLLRLHNWPAVVRYGAMALHANDSARLARLIGFTLRMDIAAAIGSMLLLQIMIYPLAHWIGLPQDMASLLRIYALSIVLMIPVPTHFGILRLFEQFKQMGMQSMIEPMIRLIGSVILWSAGAGLESFLALWFLATVISRLALFHRAWRELARHGLHFNECLKQSRWHSNEAGIWKFILSGSYITGLQTSESNLSLMLVGGFLGPAAAGVFRIAQQYATVLVKPTQKLLAPAIYPEFAKIIASGNLAGMCAMMWRCTAIAAALAAIVLTVLAVGGEMMIQLTVGREYLAAYSPMLWLAVAGAVIVAVFPLEPALSASGYMRPLVIAQTSALVAYVLAMVFLVERYELMGAAMASLVSAMTLATLLIIGAFTHLLKPMQAARR
ncbi:MAG: oligosaccharide flippase family protein, partial [Rickettsiales bacterium]|nr:oligosaccharide flippase family protein [Rickettsiales bacterium]